jgi:hypothetical protein
MGRLAALGVRIGKPELAFGLMTSMLNQRADAKAQEDYRQGLPGGAGAGSGGASAPAQPPVMPEGDAKQIEQRFITSVPGLTNPVGRAAVAAYGLHESGYSPANVNRRWSDPSESGQPGTSGGIMSLRNDRLAGLYAFAAKRGEQPNNISPETQAAYLGVEDPTLVPRLNAAKTPEEAHDIMRNAWQFAGYDRPGGENAARLATTKAYASRFTAPTQVAENEADVQRLEQQTGMRAPATQVAGPGAPLDIRSPAAGGPAVPPQAALGSSTPDPSTTGAGAPAPPAAPRGVVIPPEARRLQALARRPNLSPALSKQYSDEAALIIKQENEAPHLTNVKGTGLVRVSPRGGPAETVIPEAGETRTLRRDEYPKHNIDPNYQGPVQVDNEGKLSFPGRVAGESGYNSTVSKAYGDTFVEMQKAGRQASTTLNTLSYMGKLIDNPNLYSGTGSQAVTQFRRAAASFGLGDTSKLGPDELFDKLANRLVVDTAGGSLGTGFSNADRSFIQGTVANRDFSKEGNRAILDALTRVEQRKGEIAKMARAYASKHNGQIDPGFDDELAAWAEKNPIFPQTQQPAAAPPDRAAIEAELRRRGLMR